MKSPKDDLVITTTDGKPPRDSIFEKLCDWPWAVIASVFGLIAAGIAYSLGDAYYNAYLGKFAVFNGAFPADHPTHFVLAVWGGLHATILFQNWLSGHVTKLLVMTVVFLVYFAALPVAFAVISPFLASSKVRVKGARALLTDRPRLRQYIGMVMAILFFLVSAFWFCLFVPPLISIPSAIGQAVGEDVAKNDIREFDKGCEHSRMACYQAISNGKEIARGFVVAQSPDRVALYDRGKTIQIPLADVALRTLDTAPAQSPNQ
ncbi:hypothetical protein EN871_28835 [bacterium M00.F.Ca.ET.228.01.1.1]|nr:hypothetical protein EN871_28835 [bacterium M00.F.Ca.ET.228.01.1.1]TGR96464.1 hypothetical protein EN834_27885 [bacterium M00.F.Ca.ET.191.01.1.1]TGT97700.1 hypothetical protein EN798_27890 [bacterium M00.F.Ca.ET.155.01.1.1]